MGTMDAVIASPANPRIKALAALRRRRQRDDRRECVVDGRDELALALRAGVRPTAVYHCPELYDVPPAEAARRSDPAADPDADPDADDAGEAGAHADPRALLGEAAGRGAELVRLSRTAFEKASYRQGPDGMLAVVPAPDRTLAELRLPARPLIVVAQGVEKPGNLGAMLRTADAAGVCAVVAADAVTDWSNPNVVRASKGTVFAVPVATATGAQTLDWLARSAIPLVATTPDADHGYDEIDYRGPVAIAVGAERTGLDATLLAGAAYRVSIPMHGLVDSLNVATAMALVTFEAVRQRRRGR